MAAKKKWTAHDVEQKIRAKHKDTLRYAVFSEVAQGTGLNARSWIDVAVFWLWPSDGLTRSAFEIKVARADFVGEIQNREKNRWAREHFHEFWYATGPGVVKSEDEIPTGCGWMLATGRGMTIKKLPQRLENPKMSDTFLASCLRSAQKVNVRAAEKERERVREDIITNDRGIHADKIAADACRKFLNERHEFPHYDASEENLLRKLRAAIEDHDVEKLRRRVDNYMSGFQSQVQGMFRQFCLIANVAFDEIDQANQFVYRQWNPSADDLAGERMHAQIAEWEKLSDGERSSRVIAKRVADIDHG